MVLVILTPRYFGVGGINYYVKNIVSFLPRASATYRRHIRKTDVFSKIIILAFDTNIDNKCIWYKNNLRNNMVYEIKVFKSYSPNETLHLPSIFYLITMVKLLDITDVLHINSVHSVASLFTFILIVLFGYKSKKRQRLIIFSPHYLGIPRYGFRRALFILFKKIVMIIFRFIRDNVIILAASSYEKNLLIKDFPIFRNRKILVVPIGINTDVLNYRWFPVTGSKGGLGDNKDLYLIFPGRVDLLQKRQDLALLLLYLLQKFSTICNNLNNKTIKENKDICKYVNNLVANNIIIRIKFIGDGPHLPYLKQISDMLGIKKYVEFLPWMPRNKYLEHLALSLGVIQLSNFENYNIIVREALRMRVPIFISFNTALNEIREKLITKINRSSCYIFKVLINGGDINNILTLFLSFLVFINNIINNLGSYWLFSDLKSECKEIIDNIAPLWVDVIKMYLVLYSSII